MQVTQDQDKGCHAGVCVRSLPDAFKIEGDRLVLDTDKADAEEINNVVDRCPYGALQWVGE
jgi:uncharacterized Fe-S cluster protein YjdI